MEDYLEQAEPILSKHKEEAGKAFSRLTNFLSTSVKRAESVGKNQKLNSTMIMLALAFAPSVNEVFIEKFLVLSHESWKFISVRDLEGLKNNVGVIFDFVPSTYVEEIISYLTDREIISEEMLLGLWKTLDDLCVSCIKYCHHRRGKQDGKYRFTFAPSIKVKDGVELFKIHSF